MNQTFARAALSFAAGLGALACPAAAHASGYDTPMLYSARHMGMGGTAIGYVNDPSSLFHNPAGLGQIERGEVLGDFSLLLGGIHASPGAFDSGKNIDSDLTVAPFFLVGGAYRLHEYITIGAGVYPVASAGGTFHYPSLPNGTANDFEDRTDLFFLEASPAVAVNPLPNLRFGLGYRITYVHLTRFAGADGRDPSVDFKVSGQSFTGFRLGAQYDPLPWLHLGAVYRNKTTTKVTNSQGIAFDPYTDISTHFTLPAKLGVGTRLDFDPWHLPLSAAVDFEYSFNSENQGDPLRGTPVNPNGPDHVDNVFEWTDSQTVRVGAEYRLWYDAYTNVHRIPLRVGYVFDSQSANARYPTAFGTPPGATQVFTLGSGYNGGRWQTNVAYAYRVGTGDVSTSDIAATPDHKTCAFCSYEGHYKIHLNGIYVDASYKF
ncbi:MAG: outer membrane protein transport protein [Myxococcales bacterium]